MPLSRAVLYSCSKYRVSKSVYFRNLYFSIIYIYFRVTKLSQMLSFPPCLFIMAQPQIGGPHDCIEFLVLQYEMLPVVGVGWAEDLLVLILGEHLCPRFKAGYHFFIPIVLLMNDFLDSLDLCEQRLRLFSLRGHKLRVQEPLGSAGTSFEHRLMAEGWLGSFVLAEARVVNDVNPVWGRWGSPVGHEVNHFVEIAG